MKSARKSVRKKVPGSSSASAALRSLASVAAARHAWLRAQVRLDNLRILVELRRSEESTRRAEMNLR